AAIAIAGNKSRPAAPNLGTEISDVIGVDNEEQSKLEPEEVTPPDQVQPTTDQEAFPEENSVRLPTHPRKKTPVTSVVRSIDVGNFAKMALQNWNFFKCRRADYIHTYGRVLLIFGCDMISPATSRSNR